jgi:glutathione S-transferase
VTETGVATRHIHHFQEHYPSLQPYYYTISLELTMLSHDLHPTTTLWLWPTGLFPRRVIYYLRAKNITLSLLRKQNISIIPVVLDMDGPAPDLVSRPGLEARPANTSLPVLRITYADGTGFWIRETNAILEYFEEEVFSVANGYPDLRGSTIQQRARTRDVLSLLSGAIIWSSVELVHSDPKTISWSGLKQDEMSASAAVNARGKFDGLLSRLENWVQGDVISSGSKSLSGAGEGVTLADLCLMAQVEYMREMYGMDWVGEHGVLRVWCDRTKGEVWVVSRDLLREVEETGDWARVLGE